MITRENLNKLHELTEAVNTAKENASELLRTAQDRFKDKTHKIDREGKEIEIAEKTMWLEVFHLGPACESGKILQKEYPEVFEAYQAQEVASLELKKFCISEIGVDYTQLTLSDYLRLTESLFSLLLNEITTMDCGAPIDEISEDEERPVSE
ncbi:TPA: hypothetical protein DEB29_03620 [Candidatus Wolfebacteria bacterium]|nr:hypothetical protein [Candidatus Wolfebacteria bacterium]